MKSFYLAAVALAAVLMLGACGSEEATGETQASPTQPETTNTIGETKEAAHPQLEEPGEDTVCEYCQMTVYNATHELGAFTAQGVKADGSNAFFDDVGCMLNQERVDGAEMEKFVRDYNTLEWIPLEEAVIVKSGLKTPMNYGFAFFTELSAADAFIQQHGDAQKSDLAAVDAMSYERHEMRMEKMGEGHSHGEGAENMEHGHSHGGDGMKDGEE
ncbi:nitrous oxide reductase accessory protein NosL [Planococcus plakortidis]